MTDEQIEALRRLYAAMHNHRRDQMGSVADGPFTRIDFAYYRGEIIIRCYGVYDRGTHVYFITSGF